MCRRGALEAGRETAALTLDDLRKADECFEEGALDDDTAEACCRLNFRVLFVRSLTLDCACAEDDADVADAAAAAAAAAVATAASMGWRQFG